MHHKPKTIFFTLKNYTYWKPIEEGTLGKSSFFCAHMRKNTYLYNANEKEMTTHTPFSRPMYIMLKPAGSRCNLRCSYCYYLEKSRLYESQPTGNVMSDAVLERFIRQYIEAQTTPYVQFTWHGGEAMMRPLSFYQRAIHFQQIYGKGYTITNCLQTNGTLLDDKWCEFLKRNNFLVGISIDGPKDQHDRYRRDAQGRPTFDKVINAIRLLNRYDIDWNALAVVNNYNVNRPLEFYRFFKDIGCRYIQFSPIVERITRRSDALTLAPGMTADGSLTETSITPDQWGAFLCTIFDEWVSNDVGEYYVQLFESTLANWVGVQPGMCTLSSDCGHAGVMEFNGDVYSCDHFVYPEHRLGNIHTSTIVEMMYSPKQQEFARMKHAMLPRQCRECKYLFACNGECPKNRFLNDRYGNFGLNYLCAGYHRFFAHVAPYMEYMKHALTVGDDPASIMTQINNI